MSGFSTVSMRPGAVAMGHVLNIDHFVMSHPTFPPHPHAGFSAVTWMVPWSRGSFINRDSHGDRSRIAPGDLHWTLAGSGMFHEEIPEVPGIPCEGLQIFVKLPDALELERPRAFHIAGSDLPGGRIGDATIALLVGRVGDAVATLPSHALTTLAHVQLTGHTDLEVPGGVDAFAMVLRGRGRLGQREIAPGQGLGLDAGPLELDGDALDLLLGWSEPMAAAPMFRGPFCMFRPERLAQAVADAAAGRMGGLSPSPVRWVR